MKKLLILFLFFFEFGSYAQSKSIDSLKAIIKNAAVDSIKYKACVALLDQFDIVGNNGEFDHFAHLALDIAKKNKNFFWMVSIDVKIAQENISNSQYDSALLILKEAEQISINKKFITQLGLIFYTRALYLKSIGDYNLAIENAINAVRIFEQHHDTKYLSSAYDMLGNLSRKQKAYHKALVYYKKSFSLDSSENDQFNISVSLSNIGLTYSDLEKQDTALMYYTKALEIKKRIGNKRSIASSYNLIGSTYTALKKYEMALEFFNKALVLKQEVNESKGCAISLLNIGEVLDVQNKHQLAIKNYQRALIYAQKAKNKDIIKEIYKGISASYLKLKEGTQAYHYLSKYIELKDSIYNEESLRQTTEMQTKYETDKKETENKLLQTENTLSSKTIKQQKTLSYFTVGGLILALLFAYFIFRGLKNQRNANTIITQQKKEVEKQKHLVDEKQKEILDSIHYAKRIQSTLLAHTDFVNENIPYNFILFKPKDIVSGDFYWATKKDHLFYLAVCDSTGHGVPGAFMSLLNIGFLSEAINEKNISEPHEVFNYVRNRLINSISKDGQQDGFDGILVCFNQKTKKITYAAAHNAPVIIRNSATGRAGIQIIELEKDKMPVGKGEIVEPFKLREIDLKPNDSLYLYTDGYADQFGGPKGKKFLYKRLNELLVSLSSEEIHHRGDKLHAKFEEWRGNLEQIDDVLIVGIKINT